MYRLIELLPGEGGSSWWTNRGRKKINDVRAQYRILDTPLFNVGACEFLWNSIVYDSVALAFFSIRYIILHLLSAFFASWYHIFFFLFFLASYSALCFLAYLSVVFSLS